MTDREDPAMLVLLVVPGSKVRSLLTGIIANPPADPGLASQNGEGVTPRFTLDLLSADTLETVLKMTGHSAPVLLLQQAETEDHKAGYWGPGEEEHSEAQAKFQVLLARVLAAAEEEGPAPDHPDAPDEEPLSPREIEVLALLTRGASNQRLSQSLCISLNTVKTHLKHVMRKLNTTNREQTALVGKLIFQANPRKAHLQAQGGPEYPSEGC